MTVILTRLCSMHTNVNMCMNTHMHIKMHMHINIRTNINTYTQGCVSTKFVLGRPSQQQLTDMLAKTVGVPYNHAYVGTSKLPGKYLFQESTPVGRYT